MSLARSVGLNLAFMDLEQVQQANQTNYKQY